MIILGALLVVVSLLYLSAIGLISEMHRSDAAGNGLTQSFAFLVTIALWIVLTILLLVAAVKSEMSGGSRLAAVILVPASGAAALAAIGLLKDTFYKAKWPIVVPALVPLLITGFALWASFPAIRSLISAPTASCIAWTLVLILSIAPWPEVVRRARSGAADRENAAAEWKAGEPQRIEAERRQNLTDFRKLTQDSELRDWLTFRLPGNELREQAFAGIRTLPHRQADAERMLRQGLDYFWDDLPQLGLEATPLICECARKFLRERAKDIQPHNPADPPKFSNMIERVEPYLPTMKWLVENHCECEVELAALEETVRIYPDSPERARLLDALKQLRPKTNLSNP